MENLKDHKQSVHEGILRACNQCKFTTKWRPHMMKHKLIHNENEADLSECGHCGVMFRSNTARKCHIAKVHKKKIIGDV